MPHTMTNNFVIKHMIELKSCGCVFCYTQDEISGRTKLFLIFREKDRVYFRNGLRGIWEEIIEVEESRQILQAYDKALAEKKVPCFATSIQELAYA